MESRTRKTRRFRGTLKWSWPGSSLGAAQSSLSSPAPPGFRTAESSFTLPQKGVRAGPPQGKQPP